MGRASRNLFLLSCRKVLGKGIIRTTSTYIDLIDGEKREVYYEKTDFRQRFR